MLEKKGFKIAIGIIAGLVVGAITVIAAIYILILVIFFGGPPKVTKGIEKYEQTMKENTTREYGKARTEFLTFPKKVPESAFEQDEKPVFYNSYQDTWDDPTYEVYLKCQYSDEDYQSEIERLSQSSQTYTKYDDREKRLIYDNSDRFAHPAYIAIDHNDFSYEYAMDLGDNSIAYIYVAYKTSEKSLKKIPKEYLPADYEESLTLENGGYSNYLDEKSTAYNIYQPPMYKGHSVSYGLNSYNKVELENAFAGISGLLVFPKDINGVKDGYFKYSRDDDSGYVTLEAEYSEDDYKAEEARLKDEEITYTTFDANTYEYPAYVLFDGEEVTNFEDPSESTNKVFEYALMDSQNNKISYVLLINPTARDLRENDKYLAIDRSIYQ